MSFKSRDLMANVFPAQCGDLTKAQDGQCVDPTKAPQPPPSETAERELSFALLRRQLRAALSLELAAQS